MKKLIIVVVIGVIACGAYYFVSKRNTAYSPSPTPTPEAINPAPSSGTANIDIQNSAFSPMTITVKAGTKVVWTNKDSITHTVTSDAGAPQYFTSRFPAGGTFGAILTAPGTYHYHCDVHPEITGTVIVTQ
ncbi:MAG: cupredoxin domain-containing protein [Candidatus Pacebacteria bacterium]|nr:cupredoxin domain-containing protein [Candidatus Paceibacterota bacterium]